ALRLSRRPNVLVTRSLSKSHSLAGIRFGFAVGDPALVRELGKVKGSYNCDTPSLVAAAAGPGDRAHLQFTRGKILGAPHAPKGVPPGARLYGHAESGELRLVPLGRPTTETDLRGAEAETNPHPLHEL